MKPSLLQPQFWISQEFLKFTSIWRECVPVQYHLISYFTGWSRKPWHKILKQIWFGGLLTSRDVTLFFHFFGIQILKLMTTNSMLVLWKIYSAVHKAPAIAVALVQPLGQVGHAVPDPGAGMPPAAAGISSCFLPCVVAKAPLARCAAHINLKCTCLCLGHSDWMHSKITLSPLLPQVGIREEKKKKSCFLYLGSKWACCVWGISAGQCDKQMPVFICKADSSGSQAALVLPGTTPQPHLPDNPAVREIAALFSLSFTTSSLLCLPREGPVW